MTQPGINDETASLRARIETLEQERAEQIAAAHSALAAAQDRSYWLDRWNVDLNALMRRPGASELRALLRALRAVARLLKQARGAAAGAPERAREKLVHVRHTIEEERSRAQAVARER